MKTSIFASVSAIIMIGAIAFSACKREPVQPQSNYSAVPVLPAQPYNYAGNSHLATLGRVLFYDTKLSLNNTVACGSCHKQAFAFSDNKQFSMGLEDVPTKRNVSTLVVDPNSKFWDGRADSYNNAVLQPLQNHAEMKVYDFKILADKLNQISYYPQLFSNAFGGGATITATNIQTALVEFLNNFNSMNSRYDASVFNNKPLTGLEAEGHTLFTGKGRCDACHSSQALSGWQGGWENIGLDMTYTDKGVGAITGNSLDDGKFVIPSLKNIALSAPYMHDGRFKTLREVLNHYSEGIQNHPNLSWVFKDFSGVKPLNLTEHEKVALEAFLNTLTDYSFISDVRLSDPFRK